ncbi:MAG: lipid-A-disaccharide synthase N-terminal domain-containing protein [Burkholderiales bacterium]|nr:lipid-A-disaccharide synthase N-terminal domain-containing protein [Phycisphaerae bacterium]
MHRDRLERSWGQKLLNVSDPFGYIWVSIGLLGQVLFTGRMIVQWLASERSKKSVVPPVFWWMSLAGSTMLMVYFLWRRDPIGLLGQSFGWFIYLRNLWMIYRPRTGVDELPKSATNEIVG